MPSRKPRVSLRWRQVPYHLNTKVYGQRAPFYWSLMNSTRTYSERFMIWLQNRQCQHYGPKSRIPELFQRRDLPFFALQNGKLRMKALPPACHHNLLDAAAQVGALEVQLGYTFKNRMTCIQALKVTGTWSPLYFDGTVYSADKNNRLALLGDRVLSLAICEIWYHTEHSTKEYSDMSSVTLSRAALAVAGRALGLRESILSATGTASRNHVAETVEAVLGAIYVDSNFNVQTVKDVIKTVKLDDHRFLRAKVQVENEVVEKVALHAAGEYQDDNHLKNDLFYRGEPTVQDLSKRSIRIAKRQTIRSEGLEQAPIVNIGYNAEQNHELNNNEQQSQAPQIARAERVCDQDIENVIEDGHQSSASVTLQTHTDAQALHTNNETITSKVQLEIDLLQRLSEERVERSGAATEALHKHAMLLKDGVNVSPLRVFREIRAEIGRAYDKKLRALEKRNRAEGMALQMAMQKAHEEMRAEKKARLAEEKARSELAALAPGDGKKAEKTKVELTKLTTVVLSSKGSPGTSNLMHAKATSPLAFPDPFYAQTTDRDNASEVEGTREALWRSSAQSQTSRPSSPDERLIELAKRYQAPDTKGEELVPHITATRPNADERDGIARTSKQNCQQLEQGIARLYTHAWSSPKSELQAVSQMREEQKPSCVPMRESPRSQDTKPSDWTVKDGANSMIYESEMDLLLGGFMKDENEEAIHLDNSKQTRNLAETTIKTAEGHGATSVIGIAGEGSNQTITTSNLAQTHTVQSIIAMREELKRQTDAQWHIEKTLGTLTRRASRIARRTRLRRTLSEVPERIRSPLSIMEPEIQSLSKPFRQGYTEEDLRPVNIESQVY